MSMRPAAGRPLPQDSDDLVTGEAVALDLPPATVAVRFVSSAIDIVLDVAVFVAVLVVGLVVVANGDDALSSTVTVVAIVLGLLVTPTLQETLFRGKTLGKLVMGLRTVRDDAGAITFRHAFVRALIGVGEGVVTMFSAALITELVSSRGKRIGDYAAGTYVIRDRFRLRLPLPRPMPPELARWAGSADIAPLPDGLALAVRQFLARAHGLNPRSRATLGADLCRQLLGYVAPAPPPSVRPEVVLAAVLAARRDRDAARLARDAAVRARLGLDAR